MIKLYGCVALLALGLIYFTYAITMNTVPSKSKTTTVQVDDLLWIPRLGPPYARIERWECGQWDGETFHRIRCPE